MFVKLGEATFIDVENTDAVINDPNFATSHNQKILSKFAQFTAGLKRIAPKANDFLYFSAIMMHSAEASALCDDGSLKVMANGEPVSVGWEKKGESWKWKSNDPSILPYRNSNRDIFPEEELLTAYKKWVGKPLCIDHKSSSVDHVRGFIVDTYYDTKLKRVIALCALDKKNYPDLAHKVSTGYSNNVSMGTAVGKAVCTECGKVARAEPDFCNHMRNKSCYGEINIDLSPIELSIVVNGADPKAKIKHIIAAANSLSQYVEAKENSLKKLANDFTFSGSLQFSSRDDEGKEEVFSGGEKNIETTSLEDFKKLVDEAVSEIEEKFNEFKELKEESSESKSSSQSSESSEEGSDKNDARYVGAAMEEGSPTSHVGYQSPASNRFASAEDPLISELQNLTASLEVKFANLKQNLNKLSTKLQYQQEENMSGNNRMNKSAYYQGAGGVNEPTPGKQKYPVDPLNEKDRMTADKQMLVDDMGAVDGLFPGDLDRKKLLARAEAEERALRRQAAVSLAKEALENRKNAYFQAGDKNPEEPTPGKPKYAPDPLAMKVRTQDKNMVGQKPFPEVGDVDGLHPSPESVKEKDELKRKEMLRRAGALKAQFVKAATADGEFSPGDSRWNVFMGDKLVLTASVNEISGGKADLMYNSIATKDFGTKLIEKVKTSGVKSVQNMLKVAQMPPAAPAAAPAAPAAAPVGMEAGMEMSGAPAGEAEPTSEEAPAKEGTPMERAQALSKQMLDLSSDLNEAIRELSGEKKEMGALEGLSGEAGGASAPKTASAELRTLANMRAELSDALLSSFKEARAELKDHQDELEIISNMYESGSVNAKNRDFVESLVSDAFVEAKKAIADTYKLMGAFVKYARGTEAMVKRAQAEATMRKIAEEVGEESDELGLEEFVEGESEPTSCCKAAKEAGHKFCPECGAPAKSSDEVSEEEMLADDSEMSGSSNSMSKDIEDLYGVSTNDVDDNEASDSSYSSDSSMHADDDNDVTYEAPKDKVPEVAQNAKDGDVIRVATKQDRAALRAKLAADMMETHPILDDAHPQGGFTTELQVKPEGDLAKVEDLKEVQKAMMEVATQASPKVRKEAAVIHRLVSEGKLDPADIDSLVAEGLDAETAKYYREYYGQVDGGKEFANALLKEAAAAKAEEDKEVYRVKIARAYELAHEMVDRGLCLNDRDAISAQVEEIMKFNDDSFDSLKRVVARHQPIMSKQASVNVPQVGVIGSGDVYSQASSEDLYSQLSVAFSRSNRKMF